MVIIVAILFVIKTLWGDYGSQKFEGTVYDCETDLPVSNAEVKVAKQATLLDVLTFHWGGSTESYDDITNQSGYFSLNYKGNGVSVRVSKEGYLNAQESGYGGKTRIGILKTKESETAFSDSTTMCKRSSECYKVTEMPNGNIEARDVCGNQTLPQL